MASRLPSYDSTTPLISTDDDSFNVLSKSEARSRVSNFMGHAIIMLNELKEQNSGVSEITGTDQLHAIYVKANDEIEALSNQLQTIINEQKSDVDILSKKEIKALSKHLKKAEKEIGQVIRNTQIEVAKHINQTSYRGDVKIALLIEDGWKAKWIRFLACFVKTHQVAIDNFEMIRKQMENTDRLQIDQSSSSSSSSNSSSDELLVSNIDKKEINRRAGVVGLDRMYYFQTFFSEKEILNQYRSFVAQDLSQKKRKTIKGTIEVKGHSDVSFESQQIPLNKEFDLKITKKGVATAIFTKTFGETGVSSRNRQEPHLINAWESNLQFSDKTIFRALRHAITSDKYEEEVDIRKKNSKQAAKELLQAALLQEIASQGLTLEEAQNKPGGFQLNFNSVSLVTPDSVRRFGSQLVTLDNEWRLLSDQIEALKSFENQDKLELDGAEFSVKVKVNGFNFGVNSGAVYWKLGLSQQYDYNKEAFKELQTQSDIIRKKIRENMDTLKLNLSDPSLSEEDKTTMEKKLASLTNQLTNLNFLIEDITKLMDDKKAYLEGDNQYEIGAKVLNLTNVMDQAVELINQGEENTKKISGFKCAFNCMSGKDRTGFMDMVAKTFAIMAEINGYYPSHSEMMEKGGEKQMQFIEIFKTMISKSGNLEITEMNTGAKGLKLGKEAHLFGLPMEVFLTMQGLSATTSS